MLTTVLLVAIAFILVGIWLRNAERAVTTIPAKVKPFMQKDWTKEEMQHAYERAQTSPTNVRPFLLPKRNRRYVVAGGSGLVGGWIVHHLLMRGEDPRAIRIIDLSPTKRKEAIDAKLDCVLTDVSDPEAVSRAFQKAWPDAVKSWPLTVFHTVAYINASDRKSDFLPLYLKVNISGTKAMLNAAKAAGATCFIATSSGSVGLKPPSYLGIPFPKNVVQFAPNADRNNLNEPLSSFCGCYAWSKAQAEKMVTDANDPGAGFLTGVIRPGHGIYGHGVANSSSLTWEYLRRGGTPTWIYNCVAQFVNAQNVSIGHLAYENVLIGGKHKGGKPYLVTDPNPAIRYGNLYDFLEQLAHPSTPVSFQQVPAIAVYVVALTVETYLLFQHRYARFLPKITGDLYFCQPATFNVSSLHLIYSDSTAQEEIGYKAPITTLEGFASAVADWNKNIKENVKVYVGKAATGAEVLAR